MSVIAKQLKVVDMWCIHGKFTSFVITLGVVSNEDHVMPAESLGQCHGLYIDARESMKAHALRQDYYYTSSKNFHSLVAFSLLYSSPLDHNIVEEEINTNDSLKAALMNQLFWACSCFQDHIKFEDRFIG